MQCGPGQPRCLGQAGPRVAALVEPGAGEDEDAGGGGSDAAGPLGGPTPGWMSTALDSRSAPCARASGSPRCRSWTSPC